MGDPKKQRKKYKTPKHSWNKARIDKEKVLIKKYGLKNKKEIWKAEAILRKFTKQAKKLIKEKSEQARKEESQLLKKLARLNLLPENSKIEDVLSLKIENILDRRIQTLLDKNKQANTINQARQFIVHGHITLENKKINVPSYLIKKDEETKIKFNEKSPLSKPDHPERNLEIKKIKPVTKEGKE
jgi:small subunit ribosomal protein S4